MFQGSVSNQSSAHYSFHFNVDNLTNHVSWFISNSLNTVFNSNKLLACNIDDIIEMIIIDTLSGCNCMIENISNN